MKTAYIQLVKHALALGHTVSVFDGEEWSVKRSRSYKAITDEVKAVEEAQLRIRDKDGQNLGWALVSAYGLEPDETVIDHTDNEFMNAWWDAHFH